jgi:hypothetical protein
MDPFTLAILFGTSALASKLGGASTKDALKGAVVNTGINALLPGAGTTGNPFIANVAKATGQDALKMMLVEGAKQGLMQRAGKKFGIDPMLLGIGANFASSYLPQNLQNVGMPNVLHWYKCYQDQAGGPFADDLVDYEESDVFQGTSGGTGNR